ncbi:MAG: hypothetical protein K2X27_07625 [Candidatus Obscuribacterales bacterium]|nr:hypothetical protein [Candidatus Obscuribacterales bacterium]
MSKVSGGSLAFLAALNICLPASSAAGQNEDAAMLAEANRLAARYSYVEAEKLYQRFLLAQPQNAMAHHMYGRMLALQTRYEEALQQYKLSLKIKPANPSVLNDVGVNLSINGFQSLGARFLKQATDIDHQYPGALNNLGVTLISLDAFRQAKEAFAKSLALQPRNVKIKELQAKAESRMADSKEFDYGSPVSWKDVPDSLKKLAIEEPPAEEVKNTSTPAAKPKKEIAVKPMDDSDKKWLEKAQPLFLELKTSGFSDAFFAGNGMVQVGDKSDSADNIAQLDLSQGQKVELNGDVTVDLSGKGELELGKSKLIAKSDECIFSVNAETGELSCFAGEFLVSNWSAVTASRSSAQVDLVAENCISVYAQDDSKIEARDCDEVTLVGHAQGMVNNCKQVVVNDSSRAVAKDCQKLTALANARVRASGCKQVEKLDHAKIEDGE